MRTKKKVKVHQVLDFGEYHPAEFPQHEISPKSISGKKIARTVTGLRSRKRWYDTMYKKPLSGKQTEERRKKRRQKLGLQPDVEMDNSMLTTKGLKTWSKNAKSRYNMRNKKFVIKNLINPKFLPKDTTVLPMSGDEPEFAKWLWGAKKKYIESNNCYAYASNQFRFHRKMKAQPGNNRKFIKDGEHQNTYINCDSMVNNIKKDAGGGAYDIKDEYQPCKKGMYKIMLFVALDPEHQDFHFFRQDKDGTWSHKQGWGYGPSKLDAGGKVIFNPRKSNLNYKPYNYSTYCSSICIPKQFKYNI